MPVQEVLHHEEQPQTSGEAISNPVEDEEAPGPSSAASSSSEMQSHELSSNLQSQAAPISHQIPTQDEVSTPESTPRPESITTPAAAAAPLQPRSPSVSSVPSPRVLTHVDSHSSTDSATAGSLAIKQSKDQSRQLLEKASLKLASLLVNANDKNHDASRRPGEAPVRRAPQVLAHHCILWWCGVAVVTCLHLGAKLYVLNSVLGWGLDVVSGAVHQTVSLAWQNTTANSESVA